MTLKETKAPALPAATPEPLAASKVDLMAMLAKRAAVLRKEADALDELALAIGEREQQHEKELARFNQLRELLKGI